MQFINETYYFGHKISKQDFLPIFKKKISSREIKDPPDSKI